MFLVVSAAATRSLPIALRAPSWAAPRVLLYRGMATSRQQPPWEAPQAPAGSDLPPLQIYNSLTRSKNAFVPIKAKEKEVSWYVCGPTVYDDGHLGHARNYVTTDIIRRIMKDYFRFKVKFVMNITDVDDKIILRGRQRHLLAQFSEKNSGDLAVTLEAAEAGLKAYLTKNLPLIPADAQPQDVSQEVKKHYGQILEGGSLGDGPPGDAEAKVKMHTNTVVAAAKAIQDLKQQQQKQGQGYLERFYDGAQDVLLPYLDSLHGSSINSEDHSIFTKLTKTYEQRFMADLQNLNCMDPDVLTRVTEYGPQIVDFVEKIQKNGFAYQTSDGSVYFDIAAFEADRNNYARLEPWNRGDKELQADGEGSLTKKTTEKRTEADFALWKSSKPGEPSWASPWGKGRPGWHIECSAMASDVLGAQFDIHSGGIDLAFPHHDNELAQSEAYWLEHGHQHTHQWVNYFMHMGHLSIQGSKMSKSLKNFTTIREALAQKEWNARNLRIVFLHGGWKEGIEVTDSVREQGAQWEGRINTFFIQVNDLLRTRQTANTDSSGAEDDVLKKALDEATTKTHHALCDSFNTNAVLSAMASLTTAFFSADKKNITTDAARLAAHWVTRMVRIFGLDDVGPDENDSIGWSGIAIPNAAQAYVYPLSETRDELRRKARSAGGLTAEDVQALNKNLASAAAADGEKSNEFAGVARQFSSELAGLSGAAPDELKKAVLALCDRLRDVDLFDRGVYLEDREGEQPALVRPLTQEERDAKIKEQAAKADKERRKLEVEQKAKELLERGRMDPAEMFKTGEARKEYSEWDADGVPTKNAEGAELPKSKLKKLRKDWERQKTAHEKWLKAQGSS